MKKFLTVLLALSVVFTYTFGTAGSVFAADTTYYASDYATALTAEKTTQLGYLESDLNQVVNGFTYTDGYYNNYAKAAYEAAADDVLDTFGKLMDTVIREVVDDVPSEGTTDAPSTQYSKLTAVVYNNEGGSWEAKKFSEVLDDKTLQQQIITDNIDVLDKTQAGIYLSDLEAAIAAVDLTKYNSETLKYDEDGLEATNPTMTAAQYVSYLIDQAEKAIDDVADKSDAEKKTAYKDALDDFQDKLDAVKTIEEEQQDEADAYKTVEAALAGMKAYATGTFYEAKKQTVPAKSDETVALDEFFKNDAFYTEKTSSKNATVFGIEVKDVAKVTRTEAIAINDAFFAAITESVDMARVYAGSDVTKVTALFSTLDNHASYTATLENSVLISDRYAEVVEYGDKLKAIYMLGFKVYDDAKVDEAVKAAEALVYADLGGELKTAEQYLEDAANEIYDNDKGLANLEANVSAYDKLMDAIEEAKDKFEGNIINYGTNATPEADKVYKKDYYADDDGYDAIKADYTAKLDAAQSYDEIESILADAKTELSKLLTAENKTAVEQAREDYIEALAKYSEAQQALVDMDKYSKGQFDDAVDDGEALINAAITVDGVKDAYADAQALFADLKTDAQLEEMAKAVDTLVAALPYLADITADSKSQVDDARDAYDKYVATAGADENDLAVITKTTLKAAEEKVAQLQKDALEEKLEAFADKLDKIPAGDASIDAVLALEEEAQALYDDIVAFNTYIEEYNDNHEGAELTVDAIDNGDYDDLEDFLTAAEGDVWNAKVNQVMLMIVKAITDNATGTEMKAALAQYEELTERQQYAVIGDLGFSTIDLLKNKIISCVESLKITACSTAAVGSITVKWTVTGDYSAADGMRVYKSTKMNSGYGATPYYITKAGATYYKNTKELKKGTRYYYKVRAYVEIDGVKYYSDYSNKAYRIAK